MAHNSDENPTPFEALPDRLVPEFAMERLNEPIVIAHGPLALSSSGNLFGVVDGSLYLRWLPKPAIEFQGTLSADREPSFDDEHLSVSSTELAIDAPAMLTHITHRPRGSLVRGIVVNGVRRTPVPVTLEGIRFYLVRFPSYVGNWFRRPVGERYAYEAGRLSLAAKHIVCTVDAIAEVAELDQNARREPGYLITHVGEVRSAKGHLIGRSAFKTLDMLHWFFALLRGARTGPVLPASMAPYSKHWLELASWRLDEPDTVSTWLPEHKLRALDGLFEGFQALWDDGAWREALRTATAWYLGANASRSSNEVRIALSQIALDCLAWVELVTKKRIYSTSQFRDLPAGERLTALLKHLRIPIEVPERMPHLRAFARKNGNSGSSCIVALRNFLVHPTPKNRGALPSEAGPLFLEAGQLGLEYFELVILALCGYQGLYACRHFNGSKGDDEVPVPWSVAV